jgi:hypothetical protein
MGLAQTLERLGIYARITRPNEPPEPVDPNAQDKLIIRGKHPYQQSEIDKLPNYVNRTTLRSPKQGQGR